MRRKLPHNSKRTTFRCPCLHPEVIVQFHLFHFILYPLKFFLWTGKVIHGNSEQAPAPHCRTLPPRQTFTLQLMHQSQSADIKPQQEQYGKVSAQWAKCILILSVSYRAISIFRRLYCTALVAVHKLAGERSAHFRILCREGVMGCLYRHCSNITVINAAFHPSQRREVLKLPLVLLLMHQRVWPNCGSSLARKPLAETVINYPIPLWWNRNRIRAFNVLYFYKFASMCPIRSEGPWPSMHSHRL